MTNLTTQKTNDNIFTLAKTLIANAVPPIGDYGEVRDSKELLRATAFKLADNLGMSVFTPLEELLDMAHTLVGE